jgi:hypothetical protein
MEPKPTEAQNQPQQEWREMDLSFIEVNPEMASEVEPKQSKFYSTANTLVGNPEPTKEDHDTPKIDGKQKVIAKTFDTHHATAQNTPPPKPEVHEPDPTPKPESEKKEQKEQKPQEARPEGGAKAGETQLAMIRPNSVTDKIQEAQKAQEAQEAQSEAPKRRAPIKSVRQAQVQKGVIEGQRMEQKGGSRRMAVEATFDVRHSAFGDYDQKMIAAVQERWYRMLEDGQYQFERVGTVTVKFTLHDDGSVSDLETASSDVGDSLSFKCEASILGAASFGKWPLDMRSINHGGTRPITFTFHYMTD